eukprot:241527-Rhodomonas_salina.3
MAAKRESTTKVRWLRMMSQSFMRNSSFRCCSSVLPPLPSFLPRPSAPTLPPAHDGATTSCDTLSSDCHLAGVGFEDSQRRSCKERQKGKARARELKKRKDRRGGGDGVRTNFWIDRSWSVPCATPWHAK